MINKKGQKLTIGLAFVALYLCLVYVSFTNAEPTGASISNANVDSGPTFYAGNRTDLGGTITTMDLDVVQQDSAWKSYIGNITGKLVLRNSNSQSIYEWSIANNALSGNVFVSRGNTVNWSLIRCANDTLVVAEDDVLGLRSELDSDSINRTFSYTNHKPMIISGVGTITNSTCKSTATWINNTVQSVTETSYFQEIVLTDTTNLVYGAFIDQNAYGFEGGNITHDFQLIIAENRTATVGHTYYFYADIS